MKNYFPSCINVIYYNEMNANRGRKWNSLNFFYTLYVFLTQLVLDGSFFVLAPSSFPLLSPPKKAPASVRPPLSPLDFSLSVYISQKKHRAKGKSWILSNSKSEYKFPIHSNYSRLRINFKVKFSANIIHSYSALHPPDTYTKLYTQERMFNKSAARLWSKRKELVYFIVKIFLSFAYKMHKTLAHTEV